MDQIAVRTYDPSLIEKLYSRVAWMYDIWSRLTEEKALQTILQWADIRDGQDMLEAGVGTGRLFLRIIDQNKNGRNVGIDLSEVMLGKTRNKCGKHKNVQLLKADITNLTDSLGTFDRIISSYVFDLLPVDQYVSILSKFQSMLRPNGKLILAYMEAGKSSSHRFWGWVAETFPGLMTHCRPIYLETFLREAGFTIEQKCSFTQLTFPSCVIEARIKESKKQI
ncbi:MAG TPA: class I SAM-dependent methyltransferase [Balneolales bacterium]|jgi:ubiquinone/menaquinone biosynthesis C-methylase UbiE|nr:class I SAM-dependent methyltransferase [Balneolales bacterium]